MAYSAGLNQKPERFTEVFQSVDFLDLDVLWYLATILD